MNRFLLFQSLYYLNVSNYHGNAGDSLLYHNRAPFSTIDNNNDIHATENCAILYTGAWWYKKCYASNLNGQNYGTSDPTPHGKGITWNTFSTPDQSLKWDIMAIRPMNAN